MENFNITLLTYANKSKRKGEVYEDIQKEMILFFKNNFPQIKNYFIYNSSNYDLKKDDFYIKNSKIFHKNNFLLNDKNRNNGIYTFIQGYLVLKSLKNINDNDFLLWHDSNPDWRFFFKYTKKYYLDKHLKKCIKNKGLLFWGNPKRNAETLVSKSLYEDFGLKHNDINKNNICLSWYLIQKNNYTINFFEKVLNYLLSDHYHKIRNNCYQDSIQDVINLFLKKNKLSYYESYFIKDKIILSTLLDKENVKKINKEIKENQKKNNK